MEYSFPRYLNAKRSVDDRALNRLVWSAFGQALAQISANRPPRLLEIGCGTGTMFQRMAEQRLLWSGSYDAIDALQENIDCAWNDIPTWARSHGYTCDRPGDELHVDTGKGVLALRFEQAELFDFLSRRGEQTWDAVVANAFLDLLDVPRALPQLLPLVPPGGWFFFSINFDGVTLLEPQLDPQLDDAIISLYHRSMDERVIDGKPSGDSRTGRHLFTELPRAGYEIVSAGSSDWVVYPRGGQYPQDEAYFLHFILHFFEDTLTGHPELDGEEFSRWLATRRAQIDRGELVLVAHQFDFLARRREAETGRYGNAKTR